MKEKDLFTLLLDISQKPLDTFDGTESLRCFKPVVYGGNSREVEESRIERDISYLLNWEEIERTFKQHLNIISGKDFFSQYSALNKDIRSVLVNIF